MTFTLQRDLLLAATLLTGLNAGLLFGFACAVMPGLARVDDRTLVATMQSVNRAIVNGLFLACFLGAPLLLIAAVIVRFAAQPGTPDASGSWWPLIGAVVFTALSYGVTVAGNIPLNTALQDAGEPGDDAAAKSARVAFERRWVRRNTIRTVASTAAFGCLLLALI